MANARILHRPYLFPRDRFLFYTTLLFFALLYCALSLVNHYLFRTSAGDLAYYNQALFDFSEFRMSWYTLSGTPYLSTWGDHFEPVLALLGPLRYIFGSWTLLLVQIAFILAGGIGVFRYVAATSGRTDLPHLAMFHFFAMFGVFSALAFDFHTTVLGAMLLPWLLDHLRRGDRLRAGLVFLLMLMCTERMAFWGVFIALGLAWQFRHSPLRRRFALMLGLSALVWFVAATRWVIPAFQEPGTDYLHIRFSAFGETPGEILATMLSDPGRTFRLLFENQFPDRPLLDNVKAEFWWMLLLSGGWAILFRPVLLLMAFPILVTKLLSNKIVAWGIDAHYSVEFAPLCTLAVFSILGNVHRRALRLTLALALVLLTSAATVRILTNPEFRFIDPLRRNIFTAAHYSRPGSELEALREAAALPPPEAAVSASSKLCPHMSMRDTLYMFPRIGPGTEYVATMRKEGTWPLSPADVASEIDRMVTSGEWEAVLDHEAVIVLRRRE